MVQCKLSGGVRGKTTQKMLERMFNREFLLYFLEVVLLPLRVFISSDFTRMMCFLKSLEMETPENVPSNMVGSTL